jgi:hypothetical protein
VCVYTNTISPEIDDFAEAAEFVHPTGLRSGACVGVSASGSGGVKASPGESVPRVRRVVQAQKGADQRASAAKAELADPISVLPAVERRRKLRFTARRDKRMLSGGVLPPMRQLAARPLKSVRRLLASRPARLSR